MTSNKPIIIKVLLPIAGGQIFDYWSNEAITVGSRVEVEFAKSKRKKIGIVIGYESNQLIDKQNIKLKKIERILTDIIFSKHDIELLRFAARYYATPLGMVLRAALPKLVREEAVSVDYESFYCLTKIPSVVLDDIAKNAKRQRKLVEFLDNEKSYSELIANGFTRKDIDNLKNKGLLQVRQQSYFVENKPIIPAPFILTAEQTVAVNALQTKLAGFSSHLLYGVTGSGKTEIYIQLIAKVIEKGQQVLVLIPEISLTPQTEQRFKDRFGRRVASLHSGLTDQRRKQVWLSAQKGELPILLGTRSAIFTPFKDLGLIVVDEEHDQSYKQQDYFTYHARDLATVRAKMLDIPLLLGSATPSGETLLNVQQNKITQYNLLTRSGDAKPPNIYLIDRRQDDQGVISQKIINEMRQALYRKEQVMLFLNKRGYAPVILCGSCQWQGECQFCSAHKTVHQNRNLLLCHHCGNAEKLPKVCPNCGDTELYFAGLGTEKIEQFIVSQFPKHTVLRLDRDNQTTSKQLNVALNQIQQGKVDIIIGTQLLVKGHHFPKVGIVGVIDSDQALYSSDFRAEERLLQQLIQVAGRAGREENIGRVYIQTRLPTHPLFQALTQHDYLLYMKHLLTERKEYDLPPYTASVVIKASYKDRNTVQLLLQQVKLTLNQSLAEQTITILGPAEDVITKKQGRFCFHLFLTAKSKKTIQTYLPLIEKAIQHHNQPPSVRVLIDIDPFEVT